MANLQARYDRSGKLISYSVRVYRGRDLSGRQLKPYCTTFRVQPTWSEATARKKAQQFAAIFEQRCKQGDTADARLTFAEYSEEILRRKEKAGILKHSTATRYRELTERIYPVIGGTRLQDLRPHHLNALYEQLGAVHLSSVRAVARPTLQKAVQERALGAGAAPALVQAVCLGQPLSLARMNQASGVSSSSISTMLHGRSVLAAKAELLAGALGYPLSVLFTVTDHYQPLAPKTILEYHRYISSVLAQAKKEALVPYNAAARATPPKLRRKEANCLQPETVRKFLSALTQEPLQYQLFGQLLLYTGARRGELLGLKWKCVDLANRRLFICNNVLYTAQHGIYEDTPKTQNAFRWLVIPDHIIPLLRRHKKAQRLAAQQNAGYKKLDFVFAQENGSPWHPDSVNDWLKRMEKKYSLPHLNPHAFRHGLASALLYQGVDPVTVSRHLGHAQVSTTENIYAHIFMPSQDRVRSMLETLYLT